MSKRRAYIVTVERIVFESGQTTYLRLGTYNASSPAAARKKAADDFGFTDAETLVAVPERYWQAETYLAEQPTLGLFA